MPQLDFPSARAAGERQPFRWMCSSYTKSHESSETVVFSRPRTRVSTISFAKHAQFEVFKRWVGHLSGKGAGNAKMKHEKSREDRRRGTKD